MEYNYSSIYTIFFLSTLDTLCTRITLKDNDHRIYGISLEPIVVVTNCCLGHISPR